MKTKLEERREKGQRYSTIDQKLDGNARTKRWYPYAPQVKQEVKPGALQRMQEAWQKLKQPAGT